MWRALANNASLLCGTERIALYAVQFSATVRVWLKSASHRPSEFPLVQLVRQGARRQARPLPPHQLPRPFDSGDQIGRRDSERPRQAP